MDSSESETLALPGGETRVLWRRSSRARRISLRIEPKGGVVVVTLPPRAGRRAGLALLTAHADWVASHLAALPGAIAFAPGALVPIGGVAQPIRHVPGARRGVWLEEGEIRVSGDVAFLPRRVRDFLRAEAKQRLSALVAEKAALLGVTVRRVRVRDTRSRWGSCGADGSLAFSWRLVMAPPFVQDYVAAHEVAHLRHMNHGPRFWALVRKLSPHADAAIAWLREEGTRLIRIG
ncbi:MAG TPA: SprT family zinc-dependent metalloprotease [Acetobacteraceae bacterium]|jgi:predicted metal-dependent hydrolase|nr:SprT family zinc-dependent metalloprotease [Acetobacteraceae bacterium]